MKNGYKGFWLFLILSIAFGFVVTNVDVQAKGARPIGGVNTDIGLATINTKVHDLLGVHMTWYEITNYLGYVAILIAGSFALIGFVQMVSRRSLFKVDKEILSLALIYILVVVIYEAFEFVIINYRPIIMPGEMELEASFPSSHTMLVTVIMGTAIMAWRRLIKSKALNTILTVLSLAVIIVTVGGRLYCGVHWLTDIIEGLLISLTLICLYGAMIEEQQYEGKH